MNNSVRILLVDNNVTDRALISRELRRIFSNLLLIQITDVNSFNRSMEEDSFDLVITKYDLGWSTGLSILRSVKTHAPECPVIMAINPGEEEIAVEAIRAGLDDFVINTSQHIVSLGGVVRLALERSYQLKRLQTTESRLNQVIESVPLGFYRLSEDWRVISCNQVFADMLKADDHNSLVHCAFSDLLLHPEDMVAIKNQVAASHCSREIEISFLQSNGQAIRVKNYLWPVSDGDQKIMSYEGWVDQVGQDQGPVPAVMSDEPRQVPPDHDLPHHEVLLKATDAAVTLFQKAESPFQKLVEEALVGIYVLDQDGKFLYVNPKFGEIAGYPPEEIISSMALLDFVAPFDLQPIRDYLTRTDPDDVLNIHFFTRAYGKGQIPIEIEVQGSRIDFNGLPALIGTILDITERRAREREMETIISISSILRSATRRSEIMPVILDQIIAQLRVEGVLLIQHEPASDELQVVLGRGEWANATGTRLKSGEEWITNVIASGQSYINPDIRSDSDIRQPELLNGLYSVIGVPLIAQRQTLGSLWVGGKVPPSESTIRLVKAIAEIAANAMYRTSLHEQTELRLQRLTALRAIDMAITASLDVRVTLSILLSQVAAQLGIDAAGVMLLNPHTQMLEYSAVRGFRSTAIQHVQQRLGEGHAGLVAIDRQPVAIYNLKEAVGCAAKSLIVTEGFETYFAVPLIAKGQVKGVLELFHRSPFTPDPEWMDFLQAVAAQAAIAIDNAELFDKLQRSNVELTIAYDATIEGWAHAMELRGKENEGHIQRLIDQTIRLARASGIGDTEMIHIRRGVLLHDIGHMAIPDSILFKPGPLDPNEWEVMHRHPLYAYELLSPVPYLRPALDIPFCHHERWDGTGYPRKLKGIQIPLPGRIFSLVDVWDAIQSDRPFRPALSRDTAVEYLQNQSGKHFDPQLVDIFLSIVSES